jgi:lysophospholipase L1-like esterase
MAPPETFTLAVTAFYDEDADGLLDESELARLPGATVEVAASSARTAARTGVAQVGGLLAGSASVSVRASSLPRFYVAGPARPVELPAQRELQLPVTLPIGSNRPNVYMAYGDSITQGEGSSDDRGYLPLLQQRLRDNFGAGTLIEDSAPGTTSRDGTRRIAADLASVQPAWVLVHYGTNDWVFCEDVPSCYTLASLRTIVQRIKAVGSLPVLATIIPANEGFSSKAPPERNEFIAETNVGVRALAAAEGALLVDLEAAFVRAARGNYAPFYVDHVHPNDRGYALMADTFFAALSSPDAAAAEPSASTLSFRRPGAPTGGLGRGFGPDVLIPRAPRLAPLTPTPQP